MILLFYIKICTYFLLSSDLSMIIYVSLFIFLFSKIIPDSVEIVDYKVREESSMIVYSISPKSNSRSEGYKSIFLSRIIFPS